MVYIEIIYLISYSIICFLIVKNIHKIKVDGIYDEYINRVKELDNEFLRLKTKIESDFNQVKKDISTQNKQYLSEMNKDISKKIKDLSDNIKNRPII